MSKKLVDYNEICTRYAKALISIYSKNIDKCIVDFQKIIELKKSNSFFSIFLVDPLISSGKKMQVLRKLESKLEIHKDFFKFMCVLCKHDRLFAIEKIYEILNKIIKKNNNQSELFVTSTHKLEKQLINKIKNKVSKITNKNVSVINIIDKRILGGVILKIDSVMIDFSILQQIMNYRKISKGNI